VYNKRKYKCNALRENGFILVRFRSPEDSFYFRNRCLQYFFYSSILERGLKEIMWGAVSNAVVQTLPHARHKKLSKSVSDFVKITV
jgi:hypothetical protein